MFRVRFFIPLLFSIFIFYQAGFAQTTKIIWADENGYPPKIQMASTDGNYLTDVLTDLSSPCGLAVDDVSDPPKIYFCERGASRILRVNLDGTEVEEVITGVEGIRDLELDLGNRKIYWVRDTWDDDAVQRANMDGLNSAIEDLYTSSSTFYSFYGIGLDCDHQKVYWTQAYNGCSDKIRRMNFDKTGFEDIITYPQASLINPWDIDISGNKLYFTDCGVGIDVIFSANLDGSAIDTVVKDVDCQFFAIDQATSRIYWGDDNKISSSLLDGSDRQDMPTGVGTFIMGIAVAHNVSVTALEPEEQTITDFYLADNYPNPFNPQTVIRYQLPVPRFVDLTVYNVLGERVQTLVNRRQEAGKYSIEFNAAGLTSGTYFYRLKAEGISVTRKMLLIR